MPAKLLNLNRNSIVVPVQQSLLLEWLSLVRNDPSLLRATEYRVRSQVPMSSFCEFVQFVKSAAFTVTAENVGFHSVLSEEFGFKTLVVNA
jgi:hypothetical protein